MTVSPFLRSRCAGYWIAPTVVLALGADALSPSAALAVGVRVLDTFVLGETKLNGEKIGEFSALVRDPDGGGFIAVSDRGYIAEFELDVTGDRFASLAPIAVHVLVGQDGQALRDKGFGPEGAALMDDGSVAVVSESGPALAVFDRTGRWQRNEVLPQGVRDATKQASEKDGVEALAWTEATGFLAMTEEPGLGQPRNLHSLHSVLAGTAMMDLPGLESISIKGMEVQADDLFILERTRHDTTDELRPFLRTAKLGECLASFDCTGRSVPIDVAGITDADFEGLAVLEDGLFLMVSDDKIDGDLRSVFVLFRLE